METSNEPSANVNLSMSLDDIIADRKKQNDNKKKEKRTPLKSKSKKDTNKPTPTQKVVGSGKAKRNSKMAARRGLSNNKDGPSRGQIDKEIHRQQRIGNRGQGGSRPHTNNSSGNKNCKVYVGNLPWDATWQELKDYVADALPSRDQVLFCEIMIHPDTKRSKGYGIVELTSPKAAQEACRLLNDTEFQGRPIFVREDRVKVDTEMNHNNSPNNAPAHNRGPASGASVYVGNLSYKTSWQDLKDHMRAAGNVDRVNVLSRPDGSSKGCGVVIYQHPKDAARAMKDLDGSMLDGRDIFVREDREIDSRALGAGSNRSNPSLSVYVGNLSYDTKWQSVKDHMRRAGNVDQANMLEGPDGRSKGCAIVVYQHPKDALRAIKTLQDTELDGRKIFVREDRERGHSYRH